MKPPLSVVLVLGVLSACNGGNGVKDSVEAPEPTPAPRLVPVVLPDARPVIDAGPPDAEPLSPMPPQPIAPPPLEELAANLDIERQTMWWLYLDYSRHLCTKAARCHPVGETMTECVERTLGEYCTKHNCNRAAPGDLESREWGECMSKILDEKCRTVEPESAAPKKKIHKCELPPLPRKWERKYRKRWK